VAHSLLLLCPNPKKFRSIPAILRNDVSPISFSTQFLAKKSPEGELGREKRCLKMGIAEEVKCLFLVQQLLLDA
jgi:hypothetical protein